MIKTKNTDKGVLHYSDMNMMIKQIETGAIYESADDVVPCLYTYEETETPISEEPITDTEALNIVTGGASNDTE